LLLVCAWAPFAHAAVCDPHAFEGAYGFQLSGTTTISSTPQPVTSVGRLDLDGSGTITGASASIKFAGLLLGNPVTGTYQAKSDCAVSWSLQDDSGDWQHFQGTMSPGGGRITFHQSDPGSPQNGIMVRTAQSCTNADFRGIFRYTLSGQDIDIDSGRTTGSVTTNGLMEADGNGNLSYAPDRSAPFRNAGTFESEDDCFVQLTWQLPGETKDSSFRGILVDGGRQLLGIQSDPGPVVDLRMVKQEP
jgi:hypothetical protein